MVNSRIFCKSDLVLIIISLLIIIPLGLFSKVYTGVAQGWVNNYAGDILYEIFWCLFFWWFFSQ